MTSLHAAAYSGDLHRVKSLVNRGVDINSQTSDRWTALHRAVHQQKEDVVRFLVDNGANSNIQNCDGQTALHVAAAHENVLIILLLIEGHAEINPRDVCFLFTEGLLFTHQDRTPLTIAAEGGHFNVVKFLCSAGAEVNAADKVCLILIMESLFHLLGSNALCCCKWTRGGS